MQILINGESRELPQSSIKLNELIEQLSLAPQRIAVEVNQKIVRRTEWENKSIHEGDRIEIVHFVGGGSATAAGSKQAAGKRAVFRFRVPEGQV